MEAINIDFSIREVVQSVVQLFSASVNKEKVTLSYHIAEEIPETLVGDSLKIRQILSNLIGNSVKFTDNGSIIVTVDCLSNDEESYILMMSVRDEGIGISEGELENIFDRFTQVQNSAKYGGTGLGLAISQQLAFLMGTQIKVESEFKKGSEFKFELRIFKSKTQINETKVVDDSNTLKIDFVKNIKILVVEDDPISQKMMTLLLTKKGYDVSLAKSGEESIELCEKNRYDLILMDINLPGISGIEATKQIRDNDKFVNTRSNIIAISASTQDNLPENLGQHLFNDYLLKPVDVKICYQIISEHTQAL